MRLELGEIKIKDIQFSTVSKIEKGVLFINKEDILSLVLEDEKIKSLNLEIAKPGDSTRITPVKDVIEPRVKVSGNGGIFPGILQKVDTVGEGRTHALKDMGVVTCGKIVGFQEGIIDMSGVGADYSPFSKLNNLCLVIEPIEGLKQYDYEYSARMAGLKTAEFIG